MLPERDENPQKVVRIVETAKLVHERSDTIKRIIACTAFGNLLLTTDRPATFKTDLKNFTAHFKKSGFQPATMLPSYTRRLYKEAVSTNADPNIDREPVEADDGTTAPAPKLSESQVAKQVPKGDPESNSRKAMMAARLANLRASRAT